MDEKGREAKRNAEQKRRTLTWVRQGYVVADDERLDCVADLLELD